MLQIPVPFEIDVDDEALHDLRSRLQATRWAEPAEAGWEAGVDPAWIRGLVAYWGGPFDWRAVERQLNRWRHFLTEVRGARLHHVQVGPSGPGRLPVLLLHGWPGSYVQMLDLAQMLADPVAHGGDEADVFDVVVGSLPGFAYSEQLPARLANEAEMADRFHHLMTVALGHEHYAVRGSDWGAGVASHMAARFPTHVVGIHLSGTSPHANDRPMDATDAERGFFKNVDRWRAREVGYGAIQRTKPATLTVGLNDSPAGLAAWIGEKFRRWSDCGGDIERRFSNDELLTNIATYWFTGTIGSSVRLYRESVGDPDLRDTTVPVAWLMPDNDMFPTPREWAARSSRIDRWTHSEVGGHFLEWEEPALVASDMRDFFRAMR